MGARKDPLQHVRHLREADNAGCPSGLKDRCRTLLDARQLEQLVRGLGITLEASPRISHAKGKAIADHANENLFPRVFKVNPKDCQALLPSRLMKTA